MTNLEIIQHIIHRVGMEILRRNGEPFILQAMNNVYHRLNRELLCLTASKTWNSFSSSINYVVKPSYFIKMKTTDPEYDYVDYSYFLQASDSANVFSIFGDRIYFNNVDDTTSIIAYFYSAGLKLVTETPGTEETDEPEWPEEDLHQILIYGTALELSADYPLRMQDERNFIKLRARLSELKEFGHGTPKVIGGPVLIKQEKDPYL